MLALTREEEEQVLIGSDIRITVIKVLHRKVEIGIEAPRHLRIERVRPGEEVYNEGKS